MATYSMLPCITQAVQQVHGRADGIVIKNVVSRMLLTYPLVKPAVCEHSVCIIASTSGEQYIADFTLEQFGFASDMWLMKRSDYHDLVCSGFGGVCIDEEWHAEMERLTSDVQDQLFLYKACQATRKACGVVETHRSRSCGDCSRQTGCGIVRSRRCCAMTSTACCQTCRSVTRMQ